MRKTRLILVTGLLATFAIFALVAAACGDDDGDDEPTATSAAATTAPTTAATSEATAASTGTATSGTPSATADPCTLGQRVGGGPLEPSDVSFELGDTQWQFCIGGAAAGSSEKYLYRSEDGGSTWALIAQTTLGNPPPVAGAGTLPNGGAAQALFFVDQDNGWLGLGGPGQNLFRSTDGGHNWTFVDVLEPGVPVSDITFTDAQNGTLTTPDGNWTTSDGGDTWTQAP
jgi:photosystem II stability/assembly factor-like uncharacterized protein